MTPMKECIIDSAKTFLVQITTKRTNKCDAKLSHKINTQSEVNLNKIMVNSVLPCDNINRKCLQVLPNLLDRFGVSYIREHVFSKRRSQYLPGTNKHSSSSWKFFFKVFLLSCIFVTAHSASTEPSGIRIDPDDGGYTGIVFEIKEEVPEESCAEILKNLKVRLS